MPSTALPSTTAGEISIMAESNGLSPNSSGEAKRSSVNTPSLTHRGSMKEKVLAQGFLSTCLEIQLENKTDSAKTAALEKRMIPKDMQARSMGRWLSASASFRTEIHFYREFAETLTERGCRLAKVHEIMCEGLDELEPHLHGHLPSKPDEDAILEKVMSIRSSIILELLSDVEYTQLYRLHDSEVERVFDELAQLHGASYEDNALLDKAQSHLSEMGGHWSPFQMRGWFAHKLQQLPESWKDFCGMCASKDLVPDLFTDEKIVNLGVRLQKIIDFVERLLRDEGGRSRRSIIHGDLWSGNLMFSRDKREVVMVDFQFCGVGLGAMDVTYLLLASADLSVLDNEEVLTRLLIAYMTRLEKTSGGKFRYRDVEELKQEIKLCTIEIVIKVVADTCCMSSEVSQQVTCIRAVVCGSNARMRIGLS